MRIAAAALAIGLAAFGSGADAQQITGAGATFPYPIYAKWSDVYSQKTGIKLNYQSIGSGGGIAQIKAATVAFGASDAPLPPDQLQEAGLAQFPMVIGGVVPVVNIEGIQPGQLRFTGPMLADIYLGKIKKWDDPEIAKVNPGVRLPGIGITVVHRSDGSGTTFNWVNYLSKVSPEWKSRVGEGTAISWPTGIGGKGNEGVAAYVNRIKGSVGHVEYAYVLQNKMTYALMQNAAGQFVKPDIASFQAAAASADWSETKDFYLVLTNAPGAQAYPVTAATFILMHRRPKDPAGSKAALAFFKWCLENGQQEAEQLDYVPLPDSLAQQIEAYWRTEIH